MSEQMPIGENLHQRGSKEVATLYKSILQRDPDPGGLSNYTHQINGNTLTLAQVEEALVTSDEYKTNLGSVPLNEQKDILEITYRSLVGREPTLEEQHSYLQQPSEKRQEIIDTLVNSREHIVFLQVGNDVSHLYQEILGRNVDVGGLSDYRKSIIEENVPLLDVRQSLTTSLENKERLTWLFAEGKRHEVINALYKALLNREADQDGIVAYVNSNKGIRAIQSDLLSSEEYRERYRIGVAIDDFYRIILQRPSDSKGLEQYISLVQSGNFSIAQVKDDLRTSIEKSSLKESVKKDSEKRRAQELELERKKQLEQKRKQGNREFHYTERAIHYLDEMKEEDSRFPSQESFLTDQGRKGRVQIVERNGEKEYYFHGKRVIGRDTPINHGVYLVGGLGEALVVDDTEQPLLAKTYTDFLNLALQKSMVNNLALNQFVLKDVLDYVQRLMPYNLKGVDVVDRMNGITNDSLAPLELYIRNKVGVCRHQSVLVGYLLEKLKQEGHLRGEISVDRSMVKNKHNNEYSGHAWARYKTSAGIVYIIDPANGFIDTLENAVRKGGWDYRRPEERAA